MCLGEECRALADLGNESSRSPCVRRLRNHDVLLATNTEEIEPVNLGDALKLRPLDRRRGSLAVCHEPFVCDFSGPWTLDANAVLSGGADESAPVQRAGQPPSEQEEEMPIAA